MKQHLIIVDKTTNETLGFLIGKTTAPNGDKYLIYQSSFGTVEKLLKIDARTEKRFEVRQVG